MFDTYTTAVLFANSTLSKLDLSSKALISPVKFHSDSTWFLKKLTEIWELGFFIYTKIEISQIMSFTSRLIYESSVRKQVFEKISPFYYDVTKMLIGKFNCTV